MDLREKTASKLLQHQVAVQRAAFAVGIEDFDNPGASMLGDIGQTLHLIIVEMMAIPNKPRLVLPSQKIIAMF